MLMIVNEDTNEYLCESCNGVLNLNPMYDAYFCPKCDTWAEKKCTDENCYFCVGRPDKPSQTK